MLRLIQERKNTVKYILQGWYLHCLSPHQAEHVDPVFGTKHRQHVAMRLFCIPTV